MAAAGGPPERPSPRAILGDLQTYSAAEFNQKEVDDNAGDGYHGIGDEGVGGDNDRSGLHRIGNDGTAGHGQLHQRGDGDSCDERDYPPPGHMIDYNGDSKNLNLAYSFSKYRVELFTVRPRFHFTGSFAATDGFGCHIWSSQRGDISRSALTDTFWVKIKIPGDNGETNDHDNGNFSFTVNLPTCTSTLISRLPAGATGTGTVYHVYGEITAHHELYDGESVVLFSRGEENKEEVIDGELPLSRKCVAVPIYMEPLLILYLDLHVATHYDRDDEGHTIAFRDYITFYPDQYVKRICNADHGKVKVQISYQ
ncbi:hypothetical protein VPH35_042110 [Triticum aestivum]